MEARALRPALAEIPARLQRLRVAPPSPDLPRGYLSPAASPDEMLIQQRGRKRLPVTWSPDIDLKRSTFQSTVRTPPKTPPRLASLRSTPRKRLMLDDRVPLTPEKIDFSDIPTPQKFKLSPTKATPPKRPRIERIFESEFKGPIDSALKGLSPTQLITMIRKIAHNHPEIESEIRRDMPAPDLAPLEEKLVYLKSNIFKSLPTSRLTSKTDSPAFSRVSTHLLAFKKCVVEQGKTLLESQHYESVIRYVFLAWSHVRATPVWDSAPHNNARRHCFRALATFCVTALKRGELGPARRAEVRGRLTDMLEDSEEARPCLAYVEGLL